MKNAIALTFAAVALVACSTTSDTTATIPSSDAPRVTAPTASFDAPHVTAVGTSPISPSRQLAFCKDQVGYMYGAEPQNVTTRERVGAADGGATIDVTVNKGNEGVKTFKCRFDDSNRFIDVVAMTSDGSA